LQYYTGGRFLELDPTARRNLELTETLRAGEKRGSLLWVLDRTKTAMGGRLLRAWLERPLLDPVEISRRQKAVAALKDDSVAREELALCLRDVTDLERLIARVVYGSANCRDLSSLASGCAPLPRLKELLAPLGSSSALLRTLTEELDDLSDLRARIDGAICDNPPLALREGGFIRAGYDAEVDRLRSLMNGGQDAVAAIETAEREKTGIRTLKVGYNKVFGYYLEVSRAYYDLVPDTYIRKQTLANGERFITQELKDLEHTILTAKDSLAELEYRLFCALRESLAAEVARIQRTAAVIARADVLRSLAEVAAAENYCAPAVDCSDAIEITAGRHPVVEKTLRSGLFVPNDTHMDGGENLLAIITGPNMAGKSTYMRQVALIVLLAQIGSFVPAKAARIGIVDRIFTRIGAADDLSSGQSTFMVEMNEVADILRNATEKSLLILDEIGRGTSTYDGMSIARAVLEHCADRKRLGAKTLFATHYHELSVLENELPNVKNYNIAARKRGEDIIFLRKIVRGGADRSYGIEVAKLAGVPQRVISRAKALLKELEAQHPTPQVTAAPRASQVTLGEMHADELARRLRSADVTTMTPIEAMNFLYELKKLLN
ncbi:MAG TPA: DNA mismatch repair protein MutS, partial [Oscillospiraceae bacterium]|nr:DNA mismatch repair protein MutS [Oscillospiraceae bacterium]